MEEAVLPGGIDCLEAECQAQVDDADDYGKDHVGVESGYVSGHHAFLERVRNP